MRFYSNLKINLKNNYLNNIYLFYNLKHLKSLSIHSKSKLCKKTQTFDVQRNGMDISMLETLLMEAIQLEH